MFPAPSNKRVESGSCCVNSISIEYQSVTSGNPMFSP